MASSGVLGNYGVSPMQHIIEVRVMNSENWTYYFLYLRRDRLVHFYDFILRNRNTQFKSMPGPGVNAPAATGLNAIFTTIPQRFPLVDVLAWLRDEQGAYIGSIPNPAITSLEIEGALAKFGQEMPLLRGDGMEIK
jgi:hypothetical protein